MNTKKKLAIMCPLAVIFLIVAFYVLPSAQIGPMNIKIVIAQGEFGDSKIAYLNLKVWEDSTYRNINFTDNEQVRYAEVGEEIDLMTGQVWIDKDYASSTAEAVAYTRVHIIIKNPADATVYSAYASTGPEGFVGEEENYYKVPYIAYASPYLELTEGTWTLITKYEIYA